MLDEDTIERIVDRVLRRLLAELGQPGSGFRLTPDEVRRAESSLACVAPAPGSDRAHAHPGRLLSEEELVRYFRHGVRVLRLGPRCLVTPAARDRARDLQVDLVRE